MAVLTKNAKGVAQAVPSGMHQSTKDGAGAATPSVRRLVLAWIPSTVTSGTPVLPLALVMGGSRGLGLVIAHELGSRAPADHQRNQAAEYAWFSAAASLPVVAMDAERAAAQIVSGVLVGRAMVITTLLARIGWRIDALFPALTSALFGVAARLLPRATAPTDTLESWEAADRLGPSSRRT